VPRSTVPHPTAAALKARRALREARAKPFTAANNAAGAVGTVAARELDKLNAQKFPKGKPQCRAKDVAGFRCMRSTGHKDRHAYVTARGVLHRFGK